MKKFFLMFGASAMILTSAISCKDAEENTEVEETFETTEEMATETGENTLDSSRELENTDLVESGTYTGTAKVVDQQQNEVYLQVNDTTTIELYFSNDTKIMQNGQAVAFDALQQGQRLEVEVERSGESLKPLRVSILE